MKPPTIKLKENCAIGSLSVLGKKKPPTIFRQLAILVLAHSGSKAAKTSYSTPKWERWERCRGQMKRPERVAAVDKIEDRRKPEVFIGHRNRETHWISGISPNETS